MKKTLKVYILSMGVIVVLLSIISYNYSMYKVSGNSMAPTFNDGQLIIIESEKELNVDQIAIFKPNLSWDENQKEYIKRIKGLPGDKIEIINNTLFVNNVEQGNAMCSYQDEIIVPEGHLFLVGDNRSLSNDGVTQLCRNNKDVFIPIDEVMQHGKLKKVMKLW